MRGMMIRQLVFLFITVNLVMSLGMVSGEEMKSESSGTTPVPLSEKFQQILDNGLIATDIPGVQASISTPQWTWNGAAGNATVVTGDKAVPGMEFLIASITKTFTAIAVIKLAEEGKLSLEDPITKWLPEDLIARIPNSGSITIRQLLEHTSGIADYDEMAIIEKEIQNPEVQAPLSEGIDMGINASPLYPPGTNYTYSNVNYGLLTLVVDKASEGSYEEYVNRTIIQPLGLKHTYFLRDREISGPHMSADGINDNGSIIGYDSLYVLFDRGAGDIVSTTDELNTVHKALREGKIISNASFAEMRTDTPQSKKETGNMITGYGLGYSSMFNKNRNITLEGHSGGYPGSFSFMFYCPEYNAYLSTDVNFLDINGYSSKEILLPLLYALGSQ